MSRIHKLRVSRAHDLQSAWARAGEEEGLQLELKRRRGGGEDREEVRTKIKEEDVPALQRGTRDCRVHRSAEVADSSRRQGMRNKGALG